MQHAFFCKSILLNHEIHHETDHVNNCIQLSTYCDEHQFYTLSCVHHTTVPVVQLDLCIRALLLDQIHAMEKTTRTSCFVFFQKKNTYCCRVVVLLSVRPSVKIICFRGNLISNRPIDLKFVLNVR